MDKYKVASMKKSKIFIISIFIFLIAFIFYVLLFEYDHDETVEYKSEAIRSSSIPNLMANKPLRFIPNMGQAGTEAKYHVQGAGHTVLFHEEKIVLRRTESSDKKNELVLEFKGSNKSPNIEGREKLKGVANFFKGSEPSKWQKNIPTYSSVLYKELYPGIDMAYVGEEGKLESEFYVAANTDYHQIQIEYSGIKSKKIRDDGALLLETELGELVESSPFVFQEIDGERNIVNAQYVLLEDESIGFKLDSYNSDFPVVIDPELVFITVVTSGFNIWGNGVAIDGNGDLIVAGAANRFFPATDTIPGSTHEGGSGNDGLLLKLDGTTGDVISSALFGGSNTDYFNDIKMDEAGNIYLTGHTGSTDFPIVDAAQDTNGGKDDAFAIILSADWELIYSTYLGGSQREWGERIAKDEMGNFYIAGRTASDDFPVIGGFQQQFNGGTGFPSDAFVAKFSAAGNVVYSTYLGGEDDEKITGISADNSGLVTVTGTTRSADFPVENAHQGTLGGEGDIFIARLNSNGDGLIYSTYFGGAKDEGATGLSIGADAEAIVSGSTGSMDFPVIDGESFPIDGESDGVLVMLDNTGQPIYSVRTNIPGWDEFAALAFEDSIAYPVASNDTIKIFKKSKNDILSLYFEFEAIGHSINGVDLADGNLAFAATYWGLSEFGLTKKTLGEKNGSISDALLSGAECSAGKVYLGGYQMFLTYGCLHIRAKPHTQVYIDIGVNDEGYVTMFDGENPPVATNFKANEVFCIEITGNKWASEIFLNQINSANFPFIPDTGHPIKVDLSNHEESSFRVDGSKYFGIELVLNSVHKGRALTGPKDDKITFKNISKNKSKYLSEKNDQNRNLYQNYNSEDAIVLIDTLGLDTLDFSGFSTGISLNVSLQDSAQIIDSNGTQLILDGNFEVLLGSDNNDEITVSPLLDTIQFIDGGGGTDVLNFNAMIEGSADNGSTITTPGFADVTYINFETVNLSITTDVEIFNSERSSTEILIGNYPNPFNSTTIIKYSILSAGLATLKVYDVMGREIATLFEGKLPKGIYTLEFDASNMEDGIYYYTLKAGGVTETKKMMVSK